MKIIPIENIELISKLSTNEVLSIIQESIRSKKNESYELYKKQIEGYFIGTIKGNSFELKRVLNNRFSLLPEAKGNISNENNRTKIELVIKPNYHIKNILFLLLFVFVIGLIFILSTIFKQEGNLQIENLAFLLAIGIGIILIIRNINVENKEIKTELMKVFKRKNVC